MVSPETVNTSGVVGQATSFDLTLTGGSPYTYTQTFGNICDVSINNDTATVTITPVASGTLTGSITFDNQATCNITIDVAEPPPSVTVSPTSVSDTGTYNLPKTLQFTLQGAESYTMTDTFGDSATVSVTYTNIQGTTKRANVVITPKTSGDVTGTITFNEVATATITLAVPLYVSIGSQATIPDIGNDVTITAVCTSSEEIVSVASSDFETVSILNVTEHGFRINVGYIDKVRKSGSITFTGRSGLTTTLTKEFNGNAILVPSSNSISITDKINLIYENKVDIPNTISFTAITDLTTTPQTEVTVTNIRSSDNISGDVVFTDDNNDTYTNEVEVGIADGKIYVRPLYLESNFVNAVLPVTATITGSLTVFGETSEFSTTSETITLTYNVTDLLKFNEIATSPVNISCNDILVTDFYSEQTFIEKVFKVSPDMYNEYDGNNRAYNYINSSTLEFYNGEVDNENQDHTYKVNCDLAIHSDSDYFNLENNFSHNSEYFYNTVNIYNDVVILPYTYGILSTPDFEPLPSSVTSNKVNKVIKYTHIPKYLDYNVDYDYNLDKFVQVPVELEIHSGDYTETVQATGMYLDDGTYRISISDNGNANVAKYGDVATGISSLYSVPIVVFSNTTKVWYDIRCTYGTARLVYYSQVSGQEEDVNGALISDCNVGNQGWCLLEYTPDTSNQADNIDIRIAIAEDNPFEYYLKNLSLHQTSSNQRVYNDIMYNGSPVTGITNSKLYLYSIRNKTTNQVIATHQQGESSNILGTSSNPIITVGVGNSSGNISFTGYFNELPTGTYEVYMGYVDNNSVTHKMYVEYIMGSQPQPTTGFEPTSVNALMPAVDTRVFDFTLLSGSYDSSIEDVEFAYSLSGSSDFTSSINIGETTLTNPEGYELTIESNNQTGNDLTGTVNVYANITDKATSEYLRNYTATISLTVEGYV